MMKGDVLVDSGFLVAFNSPTDKYHKRAMQFAETTQYDLLVPQVTLPEAAFLVNRAGGLRATLNLINRLNTMQPDLVNINFADLMRAGQIMRQYDDAKFDFVDCCIMALAERLNITQVCTFDRRDFSQFRPRHTDFLELLP